MTSDFIFDMSERFLTVIYESVKLSDTVLIRLQHDGKSQDFFLHTNLATKSSKAIQAALASSVKKGEVLRIALSGITPHALNTYINGLSSGPITTSIPESQRESMILLSKNASPDVQQSASTLHDAFQLAEMHVLGTRLGDDLFCDAVIERLEQSFSECLPPPLLVRYVWRSTKSNRGSDLRQLILDKWTLALRSDKSEARTKHHLRRNNDLPRLFAVDLLCFAGGVPGMDANADMDALDEEYEKDDEWMLTVCREE